MHSQHHDQRKNNRFPLLCVLQYVELLLLAFAALQDGVTLANEVEPSSTIPRITNNIRSGFDIGRFKNKRKLSAKDPTVVRMELWDGTGSSKILNLQEKSNVISLTTAQLSALNVRAATQTSVSNQDGFAGSIQFVLRRLNDDNTKVVIHKLIANASPYRLCATASCGSVFIDTRKTSTTYVLTAIPYSGLSGAGTKGKSTTTSFTLVRLDDVNPQQQPVRSPIKRVPISVPTPVKQPIIPLSIPTAKQLSTALPTDGKWTIIQSAAPITARHESCTVMVNSKIYLIGGRNRAPIDIYDMVTNAWTTGPEPPIQLHHMQCVVADNTIWIVSAWTKSYPNEETVDQIYIFNTKTLQWSTRTALPVNRRRGSAASIVVGRKIYVSHGNRGGHAISNTNRTFETLGWLDYYDIDTDTWTTNLPNAPNPRDHTGGGLVKDGTMICISGGRNGAVVGWPAVAETDCYDLKKGIWTVEADIPVLRSGSSYGTTCDGQLMIAGGEGPGVVFNDVHVFDGSKWSTMPNLSQARHGSGLVFDCSCSSDKQVFLPSGSGGPKGGPLLYSVEAYMIDREKLSCSSL